MGPGLLDLPVETIERILKEVNPLDVVSLSKISRVIHEISESSRALWVTHANNLVDRWISVPLPKTDTLDVCSLSEIKNAVIRAAFLEKNWSKPTPRLVAPVKESEIFLKCPWKHEVFIAGDYLLIKNHDSNQVIFCDIRDGSCLGRGIFECEAEEKISFNGPIHCVIQYIEDTEQIFCLVNFIVGEDPEGEGNWQMKLYQADIPRRSEFPYLFIFKEISRLPFDFEGLGKLDLTLKLFLDWYHSNDGNFQLDVYRWDTKDRISVILDNEDTNDSHENVVTSFPGRNEIFCRSISLNEEVVTSISLCPIGAYSGVDETSVSRTRTMYTFKSDIKIEDSYRSFSYSTLFHYPWHFAARHYGTDTGRPHALYSSCLLFTLKNSENPRTWVLTQYYWDADGPFREQRCIIRSSCPLVRSKYGFLPVFRFVATSFRHVVWVQDKDQKVVPLSPKKLSIWSLAMNTLWAMFSFKFANTEYTARDRDSNRRLMLATFPLPVEDPDVISGDTVTIIEVTPVTLDVPAYVLDDVREIFLSESQGVITIISQKGKIYTLRYA